MDAFSLVELASSWHGAKNKESGHGATAKRQRNQQNFWQSHKHSETKVRVWVLPKELGFKEPSMLSERRHRQVGLSLGRILS